MASWSSVVTAAPELAVTEQARFEAHGELWFGMMPGSLKGRRPPA